ncbi:hypothetical protein fh0823_27970 (plasmid) [Francisella halioticida]|uniref:hypothetical protein n=1 Tax=Francisella halioticida TaxID=549298 RepID=UPI001AF5EFCF|nr:hypothetical protein [Francisella halioticida]BCD92660.1 hypothetical protein fh0823_27970 [Francisella halioticida]
MKYYNVEVSVGYLNVEVTSLEIKAEIQREAEELATEYAQYNHDDCSWQECPNIDGYNYQVEHIPEVK